MIKLKIANNVKDFLIFLLETVFQSKIKYKIVNIMVNLINV